MKWVRAARSGAKWQVQAEEDHRHLHQNADQHHAKEARPGGKQRHGDDADDHAQDHPQRHQGTLMCHYRHQAHGEPFSYPGLTDITAHVDFTAVAEAGFQG